MTSTSCSRHLDLTASDMSRADSTLHTSIPSAGVHRDGPLIRVTSAPRMRASAASAYPIFPDERFAEDTGPDPDIPASDPPSP